MTEVRRLKMKIGEAEFEESLTRSLDWLLNQHSDRRWAEPDPHPSSQRSSTGEERVADAIDLGFSQIRTRW